MERRHEIRRSSYFPTTSIAPQVIARLAEFTEMARRTAVQNEVGVPL